MSKGAQDLLLGIVEARKVHVADAKKVTSSTDLREKIAAYEAKHGAAVSILDKIRQSAPRLAVAAEFKRASPSKGDIAVDADAPEQAMLYAQGGASVISVLTEPARFKGSLDDMLDVALKVETLGTARRPAVLRKDFIFDTYQVLEARAYGADSLLLIVAILTLDELTTLLTASRELGMEPLVEVNNEEELDVAIQAGAKLIGVNNRNLRTFKLDLNTTVDIANAMRRRGIPLEGPDSILLLALSGVFTREDALKFEECGAHGVLVGEMLMRCHNVKDMIQELKGVSSHTQGKTLVKTCGITDAETALVAAKHGANLIGIIFVPKSPRHVDLDTAADIVQVVRKFGERSSRVTIELDTFPSSSPSSMDTISTWFQSHAKKLTAASARTPLVVGVFQNQSVEYMNHVAETVGLDLIQLHGDEGFEVCRDLVVPAIRVVHLPGFHTGGSVNVEAIKENVQAGYAVAILLDTAVKGQMGGTGAVFDWNVAASFDQAGIPCLMAGGLTPLNVARAVQVATPLGVDVSSGLEDGTPGVKNHMKVQQFIRNVVQPPLSSLDSVEEDNSCDDRK
ncbi:hypothetical protein H310_02825 [Aphanomyces invadans]|uniref:Uncharacterized protein n=1 Tax=Aphanomyces invadans TaxID=157072 RepID=A0A024ULY2_9STRA|nr:hypothetical protein H310_02825 [Aphanomyces invadans]ETW06633.1 hypothetical protein H310_02825 [Aphanomyces invadans]|eukprot:XP_008864708.1 hypothetical protein H310_02825 [Aphanomyces invadans]